MRIVRRLLRIAAIGAAALVLLLAGLVGALYLNQQRLVAAVLQTVRQRTGVGIVPQSAELEVSDHLVVVLHHPRVRSGNRELMSFEEIKAVIDYHAIFFSRGLPLQELTLKGPSLRAPFDASAVRQSAGKRPERATVEATLSRLGDLAVVSRRVEIHQP